MTRVLDLNWRDFDEFSADVTMSFSKAFGPLAAAFKSRDPKEAVISLCTGDHRHFVLAPGEREMSRGQIEAEMPRLVSRCYRGLRSYVLTLFATGERDAAKAASLWYHSLADLLPNGPFSYALLSRCLADSTYDPGDRVQLFSGQLTGMNRRLGAHAVTHDLIANAAFNNNWIELLSEEDRKSFEDNFHAVHEFLCQRVACQHRELCSRHQNVRNIDEHIDHFRTTRHVIQTGQFDLKQRQDRKSLVHTITTLVAETPNSSASSQPSADGSACADLQLSLLGVKTATDALPHLDPEISQALSAFVASHLNDARKHEYRALYPLSIGRQLILAANAHRDSGSDPLRVSPIATTVTGTLSYLYESLTLHLPSGRERTLSLGESEGTRLFRETARRTRSSALQSDEASALHRLRNKLLNQCGESRESINCIRANFIAPSEHAGHGWIIHAEERLQ